MIRLLLLVLPLVALAARSPLSAQSFRLETMPRSLTVGIGERAEYTVSILPGDGFRATVNLHVLLPTLGGGAIFTDPKTLNTPYTGGARFVIIPTGAQSGVHPLIVEGWNGGLFIRDTVTLAVRDERALRGWAAFNTGNSPIPGDTILELETDREGYAWIGTRQGLTRTDGASWQTWRPTVNDSTRPTSDNVTAIAIDSTSGVWVGLWSEIVHVRDGQWTVYSDNRGTLPTFNAMIHDIAVAPDHTVYAVHGGGVFRFDGTTWSAMENSPTGSQIAIDHGGGIDVMEGHRLHRFDGRFWSTFTVQELGLYDMFYDEALDRDGRRWYVMANSVSHEENGQMQYLTNRDFVEPYSEDYRALAFGADGSLWIGGAAEYSPDYVRGSGLARYRDGEWTVYRSTNSGLPSNHVTGVRVDARGRIWIATMKSGVALFDPGIASRADDAVSLTGEARLLPNPATGECMVRFELDRGARVEIGVVDLLGRTVRSVDAGERPAGANALAIDLDGIGAGTYFIKLVRGDRVEYLRLTIAR
jgi:ligand-binding sensor domain-containing protein